MSALNSGDKPLTQVQLLDAVHMIVGRLETRIGTSETNVLERIDDVRADVQTLRAEVQSLQSRVEAVRAEALERAEAIETKLLTAFFSYQEFSRVELRKIKADLSNVNAGAELRFDIIESRLSTLDKIYLSKPPEDPSAPDQPHA